MSEAPTITLSPLTWEGDRVSLAKALVAAQKASESIKKAASNDHFKSKYADLAHVVEAVVPALNNAGVAVIQSPSSDGQLVAVTTVLLHESGASVTSTLHLRPTKPDPQGVGSAITYGRRYALLAMTGAAPEDDDGNAASQRPAPQVAPQRITPEPEGNDWWGCEGSGPSAYQAKKDGKGDEFEALRSSLTETTSGAEWRKWCADNTPQIASMPRGWRIQLRAEAEEHARELGVDLNQRRAA